MADRASSLTSLRRAITTRLPAPVADALRAARRRVRGEPEPDAPHFYGAEYFGEGRDSTDALSGYRTYDRTTSNANIAAYLLWRFLPFDRSLDIGCAKGFLVEALTELGYDAQGCDISRFAIDGAHPDVRPRLRVVDLESPTSRAELLGERYPLVTMLEVLEHLRPEAVPDVLRFVRTIADGYVVATIPSLGKNRNGPPGFPQSKVRNDRVEHYLALGDAYTGPVPHDDLLRDGAGNPIEGHLTIASFDWWTARFAEAGFTRVDAVEQAAHPVLGRYDLSMAWNLYVFHVDDHAPAPVPQRSDAELAELELRWGLDQLPLGTMSLDWTREQASDHAAAAIEREFAQCQQRQAAARPR